MEHLKLAWFHRFWIVAGLATILPLIGYFKDTRGLGAKAGQRAAALKTLKGNLEGLKGKVHPNNRWVEAAQKLHSELKTDVHGAWRELYKRQEPFMKWPNERLQRDIGDLGPTNERVTVQVLIDYRDSFVGQIDELWQSVQPVGVPGSKQLVEFKRELLKQLLDWRGRWGVDAPPLKDTWLAQEDVWVFSALLGVVRQANSKSETWNQAPIKRVLAIAVGPEAVDHKVARTKQSLQTRGGGETSKEMPYYVEKNSQFRVVPVAMRLNVDQREVVNVLAEFSDSGIPIQITQVRMSRASERPDVGYTPGGSGQATAPPPAAKKEAGAKKDGDPKKKEKRKGKAPAKEDEFFHMTELDVWGRAFLYEKPPGDETAQPGNAAPDDQPKQG